MMKNQILAFCLAPALGGFSADTSQAFCHEQGWVGRAIEIIVPAPPGGPTDIIARKAAETMQESLGHDVVVLNRPGAGGAVGVNAFMQSEPGLGVIFLSAANVISLTGANVPSDIGDIQKLTPVARLGEEGFALAVPAKSKVQTIKDFTTALQSEGNPIAVGGTEAGGMEHVAVALIAQASGVSVDRIQFTPFAGQDELAGALVASETDAAIVRVATARRLAQDGQVRVLAVTSAARVPGIEAPTLQEVGIPVDLANWRGVFGPPNMPDELRAGWTDALSALAEQPEWDEFLADQGFQPALATGEEFARSFADLSATATAVRAQLGFVKQ